MISLNTISGLKPNNTFINTKPEFGYFSRTEHSDVFFRSNDFITKKRATRLKSIADDYAQNKKNNEAIYYYKDAIKVKPDYPSPYYNLAKIYEKTGKLGQAIDTYRELLNVKPDEIEAQTLIGKCFKEKGNYRTARKAFQKATKLDPKYDFASRSLKEIDHLILAQKNPLKAASIKKQVSRKNLKEALTLVNTHSPSWLTKGLKDINIIFDKTDSLSGHKNIAQYENHKKRIVITEDYMWASPKITAAYIIHEAVHARDKDGLSSIREEQNAYQASIEFWMAHNNEIKDPELDYAANLYKENPQKLRQKVAETYKSRDKSLPEYSPNHMPPGSYFGPLSAFKMYLSKLIR